MSVLAAQAQAFYREVSTRRVVWAIRDAEGFPAPIGGDGKRAMPFWSLESRARRIIDTVPAYRGFEPHAIDWDAFCSRWVPGLAADGLLVGVNWSGTRAEGYDVSPNDVMRNVLAMMDGPRT